MSANGGTDPAVYKSEVIDAIAVFISSYSRHPLSLHTLAAAEMSLGKTITLSTGAKIPQIGLGTWLSKPNEVENAVSLP